MDGVLEGADGGGGERWTPQLQLVSSAQTEELNERRHQSWRANTPSPHMPAQLTSEGEKFRAPIWLLLLHEGDEQSSSLSSSCSFIPATCTQTPAFT